MEKRLLVGVDIGGTKCAVTIGCMDESGVNLLDKEAFATTDVNETINNLKNAIRKIAGRNDGEISAIGISCGGPLDSKMGVILSPPNLPGWDNIPIVKILSDEFGVPAQVQNDANACALAEWKFGAGKGIQNMVFLTFGTGLGAGLILDGKLFTGTNDNAGEIGHLRLSEYGPVGYGKQGSFEGFCSGGGIRQIAQTLVKEKLQMGQTVQWLPEEGVDAITAKIVAQAANSGDVLAKEIFSISARQLGKGLSIVIDVLNPELIVIGSIYARNEGMLKPEMEEEIAKDALPLSRSVCKVVPAALGESIGDYAALSVAANIE